MKLILSRKGFDGTSGGVPSPIFPDGSFLSLPIPDVRSPVRYRDLRWRGRNVGDLVERLTRGRLRAGHGAHLDPDLALDALDRPVGWRPVLGQCAAAQGHLRNQGVGVGDLFIFWGLFRRVDEQLRWHGPKLHMAWGWLRIGAVASVDREIRGERSWSWLRRHPHLAFDPDPTNTLYVAASEGSGGAGVFDRFDPARVLTASSAVRPSLWELPRWFLPRGRPALSYHDHPGRWTEERGRVRLRSAARGQEFVLDLDHYPEAEGWLARLPGSVFGPLPAQAKLRSRSGS